jgi:hypothetical protein
MHHRIPFLRILHVLRVLHNRNHHHNRYLPPRHTLRRRLSPPIPPLRHLLGRIYSLSSRDARFSFSAWGTPRFSQLNALSYWHPLSPHEADVMNCGMAGPALYGSAHCAHAPLFASCEPLPAFVSSSSAFALVGRVFWYLP